MGKPPLKMNPTPFKHSLAILAARRGYDSSPGKAKARFLAHDLSCEAQLLRATVYTEALLDARQGAARCTF